MGTKFSHTLLQYRDRRKFDNPVMDSIIYGAIPRFHFIFEDAISDVLLELFVVIFSQSNSIKPSLNTQLVGDSLCVIVLQKVEVLYRWVLHLDDSFDLVIWIRYNFHVVLDQVIFMRFFS